MIRIGMSCRTDDANLFVAALERCVTALDVHQPPQTQYVQFNMYGQARGVILTDFPASDTWERHDRRR